MTEKTSRLSGFRKLAPADRLKAVAEFAELNEVQQTLLGQAGALPQATADAMVENVNDLILIKKTEPKLRGRTHGNNTSIRY